VRPELGTQIQNLILEHLDDYELPALVYSAATILCFVFDLVSLFVFIGIAGKFKKDGDKLISSLDQAAYQ